MRIVGLLAVKSRGFRGLFTSKRTFNNVIVCLVLLCKKPVTQFCLYLTRKCTKNRPMGHIAYLKNQFQSIKTFALLYNVDYEREKKIISYSITECISFEQTWITLTQGCFVSSLVEIGPVVLEKTIYVKLMYFLYFVIIFPFEEGVVLHLLCTQGCFDDIYCISPVVLQNTIFKFRQCIFAIS